MLEPLMYMSTKKTSKYYLNVNARSESGIIRSHSQDTNKQSYKGFVCSVRGQWRRYCGGAMHRKDNSEEIALL